MLSVNHGDVDMAFIRAALTPLHGWGAALRGALVDPALPPAEAAKARDRAAFMQGFRPIEIPLLAGTFTVTLWAMGGSQDYRTEISFATPINATIKPSSLNATWILLDPAEAAAFVIREILASFAEDLEAQYGPILKVMAEIDKIV